ncbi:MAG: YCF48-related protein [Thermovirgaceae bacterium]
MNVRNLARAEYSRVWLIENRAGPASPPTYEGLMKAGGLSWPQGDVRLERVPDPERYGEFITIDKIPGEQGSPSLTITAKYGFELSDLLRIMRKGCDADLQIHMGKCKDPQSFNAGWEKVLVLEGARITNYNLSDLGALEPGERAAINEEVPFSGEDLYEIVPIVFQEKAGTLVALEVVAVVICDSVSCGACGVPSNGCDKVYALIEDGSVIFSNDGGTTWGETDITGIATDEVSGGACVGSNLVAITNAGCSLWHAPLADILSGSDSWTEVTEGFVALKCPNGIFSLGPHQTWIVGAGGYIYFTDDPTAGVVAQEAGVVTTEDLTAVHAYDSQNVVVVGENNAMLVSRNGGSTWALVTGPAPATNLTCIWMKGMDEWLVGAADGSLYYTRDGGVNWTEKTFPGSGSGTVKDIKFSSPTVGWMAHNTSAPAGRILRTIDGGNSWYVAPEGNTSIPTNGGISSLAVCEDNVNLVYGGGLAVAGSGEQDGILIKGS